MLSAEQVLQSEGADAQRGLSSAEAAARARRSGLNQLAAGQAESRWHRQWLICTAVALSVVAAAEIRKAVLRRTPAKGRAVTADG